MSENNHKTSGKGEEGKERGREEERREREEEKGESDKMAKRKLPHKMSLQS